MNLSDLVRAIPTNAERDADPLGHGKRDINSRWDKYPEARVQISGFTNWAGKGNYSYLVTLDDGRFVTGSNYRTANTARRLCERAIKKGKWLTPLPTYRRATRAEALGPIGEATGDLAKYLADWDAKHAA